MRRALVLIVALGAVVMIASPAGAATSSQRITGAGPDYTFTPQGSGIRVTAPADLTDGNIRDVFWTDPALRTDGFTCSTWTGQSGRIVQQGVALRINGGRAIAVTKNVYLTTSPDQQVVLNVELFHDGTYTKVRSFLFARMLLKTGKVIPLPWTVCAAVTGPKMTIALLAGGHSQTHRFKLPAGWVYAGRSGSYIGHLGAGDWATFG